MVMQFIANNPELRATIEGFSTGLQVFAQNQEKVLSQQQEIIGKLDTLIQLGARGLSSDGPRLGGTGVISDGVRCPSCGTSGECECYSGGSVSGSGADRSDGDGGNDQRQHTERASS
jgi:hypothetical protein